MKSENKSAGFLLPELMIGIILISITLGSILYVSAISTSWAQRLESQCEIMIDSRLCRILLSNYVKNSNRNVYTSSGTSISNGSNGYYFSMYRFRRSLNNGQLQVVGLDDLPPYKGKVYFRPGADNVYFKKNSNGTFSTFWQETSSMPRHLRGVTRISYTTHTDFYPYYRYFDMEKTYEK